MSDFELKIREAQLRAEKAHGKYMFWSGIEIGILCSSFVWAIVTMIACGLFR